MIVAVSGYNASGKSTMVRMLHHRLQEQGVRSRVMRFDTLYPSSFLTGRPKREHVLDENNSVGLRKVEAQPGSWDKPFRVRHLLNMSCAAVRFCWLRLFSRNTVVIMDRFFYDRFVNFAESGWLYRLATKFTPRPDLAFILLPDEGSWEQRILERIRRRANLELPSLSESDRHELQHVRHRYEAIHFGLPFTVAIDTGSQQAADQAWQHVQQAIHGRRQKRSNHTAASLD